MAALDVSAAVRHRVALAAWRTGRATTSLTNCFLRAPTRASVEEGYCWDLWQADQDDFDNGWGVYDDAGEGYGCPPTVYKLLPKLGGVK